MLRRGRFLGSGTPVTAAIAGSTRPTPRDVGRYQVGPKVADGGMATIFMGRRVADGQLVAIKRIRQEFARNPEFLTMFLDEARLVARLRHPSIVRHFEVGGQGPTAFIAMELLHGQSLWSVWDACRGRGIRLRSEVVAWVGARVAEALHYAHELIDERGQPLEIVHRDVNATNIFVTYEGSVKIIDFGLAKATDRVSKTAAGIIKGKIAYMSPEQAVGAPIDRRTDIFALGTTLWELACDRRLFKHTDEVETLKRVHAAEVPDPAKLVRGFQPSLARTILRALARDREHRYPNGDALARDLDDCARSACGHMGSTEMATMMRELFPQDRIRELEWAAWDVMPGDGNDHGHSHGRENMDSNRSSPGTRKTRPAAEEEDTEIIVGTSALVNALSTPEPYLAARPRRRLARAAVLIALALLSLLVCLAALR